MKKNTLITLSLSAAFLSGCATSKHVQSMIDTNNLHYDAEMEQVRTEQQLTTSRLTALQNQWAETVENIRTIKINTQALEDARQNLLYYCREQSTALARFIDTMEPTTPTPPPAQPKPPILTAPIAPAPTTPAATSGIPAMVTPEPVF